MGSCLSKKDSSSSSSPVVATSATQKPKEKREPDTKVEDESLVRKEIFVIKHRKSHDKRPSEETGRDSGSSDGTKLKPKPKPKPKPKSEDESEVAAGAETSTAKVNEAAAPAAAHAPASKEEEVDVDAILIQCGRLSRSSSGSGNVGTRRNYSGSKRSYDFDANNDVPIVADGTKNVNHYSDDEDELRRHRQSRPSPSASARRRRRTPSREREGEKDERSSSRERGSSGNGNGNGSRRRVSRSPGRRSSEATTATASATGSTTNGRPQKMVSVPATVTSLVMDKSNIVEPQANSNSNANAVKRISVKRNVGDSGSVGPRGIASPRSQSPAAARPASNNNNKENQQVPSLSRNNSRKAEQSPYRRNPLSEIDNNTICNSKANSRVASKNKEMECQEAHKERESKNASINQKQMVDTSNERFAPQQGNGCKTSSVKDLQQKVVAEERRGQETIAAAAATTPIASGALTRSCSSRLSGPGLEPEIPLKPTSYTSLLLEDIQNFHQQNATSVPIPVCVTKACSIYEAVAELNSKKTPNGSNAQMESRLDHVSNQYSNNELNHSSNVDFVKKKRSQTRDPFVESELAVGDDLMEPSIHKYVTVHRGGTVGADDKEERESSGSNSFVGGGLQQWGLSTCEPGSADSSECWTSHSNNTRRRDQSPFGNERSGTSESGNLTDNAARRLNGRRRDVPLQPKLAGRGRI